MEMGFAAGAVFGAMLTCGILYMIFWIMKNMGPNRRP